MNRTESNWAHLPSMGWVNNLTQTHTQQIPEKGRNASHVDVDPSPKEFNMWDLFHVLDAARECWSGWLVGNLCPFGFYLISTSSGRAKDEKTHSI